VASDVSNKAAAIPTVTTKLWTARCPRGLSGLGIEPHQRATRAKRRAA